MGLDFCQGSGAVLLLGADPAPSGGTDRSSSSRGELSAQEPSYVSEARVMAECQAEATVRRRLPLSGLVGLAAVWAVKERWVKVGQLMRPGVLLPGGVIVYILGGVMYGDTCANKVLRQIPRSVLAEDIRRSRGLAGLPLQSHQHRVSAATVATSEEPQAGPLLPDDWRQFFSLEEQEEPAVRPVPARPSYAEMRRLNRSSLAMAVPSSGRKPSVYDELRRKNREGFS